MFLVVFISFLLLVTSSSSNNDGLSTTSTNIKANRPTGNREIAKALLHLRFNPEVEDLSGTEDDSNQYASEERENALQFFAGGLDKILGYASRISFFVNLIGSFVKEAPKYSIDAVMGQLNTQFADVKNHLSTIYNRMQKQDIDAYHAVEDAVTAANVDMALKSKLVPETRALNLFDQLYIFSNGMMGDILQVTSNLLKCASTSIYNQMEKYTNLVNIGALGLGYYGNILENVSFNFKLAYKDKFPLVYC